MHNNKKYLIIIAGPTSVGKSNIAFNLAQDLKCEVLSADSRQIYRKLDIGTAKVSKAERKIIPHHFIDILDVNQRYTASQFETDSIQLLEKIHEANEFAIVTGGTGLYLRALMEGLDEIPDVPIEVRCHFDDIFEKRGLIALQTELEQRDPVYYSTVDRQNARRLIRALSVLEHTGNSISSYYRTKPKKRPFQMIPILLEQPRHLLYERINRRVDHMVKSGLEQEALLFKDLAHLAALQTVGYQEWFPYFKGIYNRDEAIRLVKRNTRRYAKRQMTWFSKYGAWVPLTASSHQDVWDIVKQLL